MKLILEVVAVFGLVCAADWFWARYIDYIATGKKVLAANYSMLVYLLGAMVVTEYVKNYWMIIPACAGAWVGTYFGMRK